MVFEIDMESEVTTRWTKFLPPRVAERKRWHGKGNLITAAFPEMDFLIESRRRCSECNLNCSCRVIEGLVKGHTAYR